VLNLDRDTLAVAGARTVDLTQGRERERLLVEGNEHVLQAGVEILLDHPSQAAQRNRLSGFRQRA